MRLLQLIYLFSFFCFTLSLDCSILPCSFCVTTLGLSSPCAERCRQCNQNQETTTVSETTTASESQGSSSNMDLSKDERRKNKEFRQCCDRHLPEGCRNLCKYQVSLKEIDDAMYVTKTCDWSFVNRFMYCAADGVDNSKCCMRYGMGDKGRTHCLALCNSRGVEMFDLDDMKCFSYLGPIMHCHSRDRYLP